MSDRLTSPEEAHEIKCAIMQAVDDLERRGFTRGEVGACMVGIGAALTAVHAGDNMGLLVLNSARESLLASQQKTQ